MPNRNDEQRQANRTNQLRVMLENEWLDSNIEQLVPLVSGEPYRLKIEINMNQQDIRNVAIIFKSSSELMTDLDSTFDEVFHEGIHIARRIFETPPNPNIVLQGTIALTSRGAEFEKRDELGHPL